MPPGGSRFEFGLLRFLAGTIAAAALTFVGLGVARRRRDTRDRRPTDVPDGWRVRSHLDRDPGDPYNRFNALKSAEARDVMEGEADGFSVSHFELKPRRRGADWRPCALVQLPVEGPRFRIASPERGRFAATRSDEVLERPTPAHYMGGPEGRIGPKAADVLRWMQHMMVDTAPFAILVRSTGASAHAVQLTAVALAKAIVEDERQSTADRAATANPGMSLGDVQTRRAQASDADAIAAAHRDSIRTLGPGFYPPRVVDDWEEGVAGDLYLGAMDRGEVFFIATGRIADREVVLGFASDYPIEGARFGTSVYVRGAAARRGIGSALLALAEAHAVSRGATSFHVEASLAGVEFYKANGFSELSRGETHLRSGRPIACVFMQRDLP